MMHQNFYHWHNRVELKPDPALLKIRWDAAAKFAKKLSGDDACSLLHLALFGSAAPDFTERFSGALVALEPTFLPEGNTELLRVMATAGLYSHLEAGTVEADAIALGVVTASFQPNRIQPVCKELASRSVEYLAVESERLRPRPTVGSDYQALKEATEVEDWAANEETPKLIGNAILELGDTMERIAEENQYLWWLLGRRSSRLDIRRETLLPDEYALVAAVEAAERVALLPPPASVESLISEVITHCSKPPNASTALIDFVKKADLNHFQPSAPDAHQLCPVSCLLDIRRAGGIVNETSLKKLALPAKLKIFPSEAAIQLFRELMFLRALTLLE